MRKRKFPVITRKEDGPSQNMRRPSFFVHFTISNKCPWCYNSADA